MSAQAEVLVYLRKLLKKCYFRETVQSHMLPPSVLIRYIVQQLLTFPLLLLGIVIEPVAAGIGIGGY
jgi:hypothetical protein